MKDRGAISMAGHNGTAYWFSKSNGRFITSSYYMNQYPDWVTDWNDSGQVQSFAGTNWELSRDPSNYEFATRDSQPWEQILAGFGRVFPHPYGRVDSPYYTTLLTVSPAGDDLTVSFANSLIDNETLGQDATPDYLGASLSSTDYVGHLFGPSSLETEDNMIRLDHSIARLLAHVDEKIGLENTLIVLASDHGAPENPRYLVTMGIQAGTIDFNSDDTAARFAKVNAEFDVSRDLIQSVSGPYIYLNDEIISEQGLDRLAVQRAVADGVSTLPGVEFTIAAEDLRHGNIPQTRIADADLRNFHKHRSGDVYVVYQPHWFVADLDGLHVASMHGTPWIYDTHVPMILVRPDRPANARITDWAPTVALASTLAAIVGTRYPSGSDGIVLKEAVEALR